MEIQNIFIAFVLTLAAGLAMGIGSIISFLGKKNNNRFLSVSLGFASGVMIFAAFVEIFPEAKESLSEIFGEKTGFATAVVSFLSGMVFMIFTEKFCLKEREKTDDTDKSLYRMAVMGVSFILI